MTSHLIITDALATLAMIAGVTLALRARRKREAARYGLTIAGVMLAAFGLIMLVFTTTYAIVIP